MPDDRPAGDAFSLGSSRINNIDRVYTLPEDVPIALDAAFGVEISLAVADEVEGEVAVAGHRCLKGQRGRLT